MDPPEHIHIISAGDTIHKTYPAVIKNLPTVTHTFIFAEKEVYINSARDDTKKRMWKCAIRDAIDAVNSISQNRKISCALVCIDSATFDAIRDPVLGIFSDYPDARYSFDVSAGSKRLSLGLFSMSLWVGGDSYYAFGDSPIRRVPVPAFPILQLPSNPYYLMILTILFRGLENGKTTRTLVPRETLFNETKTWQIPAYDTSGGPGRTELSPVAFSCLISTLIGWNLIREETDPETGEENLYQLTPDGELALYVYLARLKKRGFRNAPGLT
ncbi:MAG: hypothetical protein WC391_03155 [Methanoregula sp.]